MKKSTLVLGLFFLGILLITSANGQWARVYGGGDDDCAYSIQQTKDGGYIVAGYTKSFGNPDKEFWILKLNSKGKIKWQRTYGGYKFAGGTGDDVATSIQQTKDGGYIVAG
ncbi:hypothetical protein NLC29_03820 [Candidatus Aminicenantes bacterium AH-873-B07]|nr:hypothetical protein [Candidatus Aminicenantes bacterium AH-873-B07]